MSNKWDEFQITPSKKFGYVDADEQGVVKWNDPEYQMERPSDKPTLQKRDR
jgi:hypothetical protein